MIGSLLNELKNNKKIFLKIKVKPGSQANKITGKLANGIIKIDINAPAEKGKANQELTKYLTEIFQVKRYQIKIISGENGHVKLIKILQ